MKKQKYFVDYNGIGATILYDKRDEGENKLWYFDEPTITFACNNLTDAQNVAGALMGWLRDPDEITNRLVIAVEYTSLDEELKARERRKELSCTVLDSSYVQDLLST